jgi:phenylpyruvate tautomerase PptA (4-oxalocrotonate tautomerase family)
MDNWMTQQEMNYGFSATATAQGKDSSPSNTQFTITVKLYDPDTGANTQESNTWTLTSSYQTFSTTLDVGTNTYGADSQLIATFLGVDPNWDGSGYDTDIQNFNMTLTYDVLESVVETINQTIVNSVNSALETIENQTTLVYNPIIQPGTDTTTTIAPPTAPTQDSFTVNVAGNNGGGVNLQFNVEVDETAGAATVEMAATNLETGVVTIDEVANISLDFSSDSGGTTEVVNVAEVETQVGGAIESAVAEATTEMQVAEATPQTTESSASTTEATTETETESETASSEGESNETETVQESSSDVEEQVADSGETTSSDKPDGDSKSTDKSGSKSKSKTKVAKKMTKEEKIKEQVDKAKQKIARKILMAMADTYNAINEATKIALMASLTDTESFKAYQKKNNEDLANWYSDLQVYKDMPQLIDPAAQLYELASDKIMNEMIDEQYKK